MLQKTFLGFTIINHMFESVICNLSFYLETYQDMYLNFIIFSYPRYKSHIWMQDKKWCFLVRNKFDYVVDDINCAFHSRFLTWLNGITFSCSLLCCYLYSSLFLNLGKELNRKSRDTCENSTLYDTNTRSLVLKFDMIRVERSSSFLRLLGARSKVLHFH